MDEVLINKEEEIESQEIVVQTQEYDAVIDISESMGWVSGDNRYHDSLLGTDLPNQHPITAITGLREELDDVEKLQTVYSDKINVANYYAWNDETRDEFGYFVSLIPHSSMIKICEDGDIFGVTVNSAGFIGGQNDIKRDNSYALVATTGLVDVRCELDVAEGDCVISNSHGVAEKTTTGCGYKVIAVNNKDGVIYASIALGVQACTTDAIGKDLQQLAQDVKDVETNIAAAMKVANDAYNKSIEATTSSSVSEETVKKALESILEIEDYVEDAEKVLESTNSVATQAKEIAVSAVVEAERIRKESYNVASDALSNVNALIEELEPITKWEDPISGNSGAEYLTSYINDGLATKLEVQTVETTTAQNTSWISKNGQNIEMAIASVDKYGVGEYSQAYGLTLEQARNILKDGMIYIPTVQHTEDTFANGEAEVLRGAYYEWDGEKWVEYTNSVAFTSYVPAGDSLKYWYIESDNAPEGYESYALYLLRDGVWEKVNTLAGNVNNRITNMIRHDVDEVRVEMVNAYGSVAGFCTKLSDTDAKVKSIASWPTSDGVHRLATIEQKASGDDSSLVLAAGTKEDGSPNMLSGATIVLNDSEKGSYIQVDADKIDFKGGEIQFDATNINFDVENYSINASKITLGGETEFTTTESLDDGTEVTKIHGGNIATGTLSASQITTGEIKSKNYVSNVTGTKISLEDGAIDTAMFKVEPSGIIASTGGAIGGWNITSDAIYNASFTVSGMCAVGDDQNNGTDGLVFDGGTVTGYNGEDTVVNIPKTYNGYQITAIGAGAFQNNTVPVTIVVPSTVTTIGMNAFYYCKSLENVIFSAGIKCSTISSGAFFGCENLSAIIIPPSVTSIGAVAFFGCSSLTSILIPIGVTKIGVNAFGDCGQLTIYTHATSKPDGWDNAWNPSARPVKRGSFSDIYKFESLISGTSFPRFYAGSHNVNHIPTIDGKPKFLVLEDGSLYAEAADIKGYIYADNGTFNGEINASKGKFGGLSIDGNNIASTSSSLSFNEDGTISADNLELTQSFKSNVVTTGKVSGRLSDSPYLLLEGSSSVAESVEVNNIIHKVTDAGERGWFFGQIKNEGSVTVTITLTKELTIGRNINVTARYADGDNNSFKATSVYVNQGQDTFSVTFPNLYDWSVTERSDGSTHTYNYRGTFSDAGISPTTFTQPSSNAATAIASSSHFVPLTDGLNLGQAEGTTWNYAYLTNTSHTSDQKTKDNIMSVDEDFSKELIRGLKPKSYTFKTAKTPRTHYGFIAQDVEELLVSLGMSTDQVGIVCKSNPGEPDGEDNHYSLNYINLIAPMVGVIQQLLKRVEELEEKLAAIED